MAVKNAIGTVYLIHFARPYGHARHYLGWTENLTQRIEAHRKGQGGRLLAVVIAAGIGWEVARVWEGVTKAKERELKKWNGSGKLCPVCRKENKHERKTSKEKPQGKTQT